MRAAERGFLLLTSHLGDPGRKVLTAVQFRRLAQRMQGSSRHAEQRDVTAEDLVALGYDHTLARRITDLLLDEDQLAWYLQQGARRDCYPVTRVSAHYPDVLRKRLGLDAPGCLWAKGDVSLLKLPAVALVGSRQLRTDNRNFAREAGRQAALQGYVLVSGNARGADRQAQDACLAAGGKVISVVADALETQPIIENVLYLSEDSFDAQFSAQRALSRNRVIHALGSLTLVAQSDLEKGGTWDGTAKNLRCGWSPVFAYGDGSAAMTELAQRGAALIGREELADLGSLQPNSLNFIDQ